jgi:hypothetical protein
MGSIIRHAKIHNWHFSPWISQAINTLRIKLGYELIQNYYSNRLGDTFSYSQTRETFGVTKLPLEIARRYDMQPLDYTKSSSPAGVPLTKQRVLIYIFFLWSSFHTLITLENSFCIAFCPTARVLLLP